MTKYSIELEHVFHQNNEILIQVGFMFEFKYIIPPSSALQNSPHVPGLVPYQPNPRLPTEAETSVLEDLMILPGRVGGQRPKATTIIFSLELSGMSRI